MLKKIYYFPDDKLFSSKKGKGFKTRRLTIFPLPNRSFHIKSQLKIGSGSRKEVFLGEGSPQTVRTMEKQAPSEDEITIYDQLKEKEHVVQLYRVIHDAAGKRSLILEYCEQGEFKKIYNNMDLPAQLQVIRGALLGLLELHNIGFLHLDCNLGNIFVKKNGEGCLGDFGSSRPIKVLYEKAAFNQFMPVDNQLTRPIIYAFLAPEIVFNIGAFKNKNLLIEVSGKADIWMLGMSLALKLCPELPAYKIVKELQDSLGETIQREGPFCPFLIYPNDAQEYMGILQKKYPSAPENQQSFEYLLWRMLHPDPNQRCTEMEAVQKIEELLSV